MRKIFSMFFTLIFIVIESVFIQYQDPRIGKRVIWMDEPFGKGSAYELNYEKCGFELTAEVDVNAQNIWGTGFDFLRDEEDLDKYNECVFCSPQELSFENGEIYLLSYYEIGNILVYPRFKVKSWVVDDLPENERALYCKPIVWGGRSVKISTAYLYRLNTPYFVMDGTIEQDWCGY